MVLKKENIYAFDDCSILHLCDIKIPGAFKIFFKEHRICPRNYGVLNQLIAELNDKEITKYRFIPSNFESNALKMVNDILKDYNTQMLGTTFKTELYGQLEEFYEEIESNFAEIGKNKEIAKIRELFIKNEINLAPKDNIPKDDDLSIISGYINFDSSGVKHIITEDSHFWAYTKIIEKNFDITVIKENECLNLLS